MIIFEFKQYQEQFNQYHMLAQIYKRKLIYYALFCYLIALFVFLFTEFQSSHQSSRQSNHKLSSDPSTAHPQQKRVILLLIDASKYSYSQQFDIIHKLVSEKPQNTLLKKCLVSEPTMTTQKIETLMTGSQVFSTSSILDAFFSNPVQIDNLISQIEGNNKNVVTMGDDTWGKIFKYSREYPCTTTFDIWDWYTCDKLIYRNLQQEIQSQNNTMIVAHFLVLDHIGHSTSSTDDPNFGVMKLKLSEYIETLLNHMKSNDVLLITGDHGMRDDGNHGGSSKEETETFLFAYSPQQILTEFYETEQIYQPDITATISVLLDIPIPTNAIGLPLFRVGSEDTQINLDIIQNTKQHYKKLIEMTEIQCPPMSRDAQPDFKWLKSIQRDCLKKLSQSEPNFISVTLCMLLMAILGLYLVFMQKEITLSIVITGLFGAVHSFSWFLIQNSSTYYLVGLITLMLVNGSISVKNKCYFIGIILFLSQFEPSKPGDYQINLTKLPFLEDIFTNIYSVLTFSTLTVVYIIYRLTELNEALKSNPQLMKSPISSFIHAPLLTGLTIVFMKNILQENNEFIIALNILMVIEICLYLGYSIVRKYINQTEIGILLLCILLLFSNNYFLVFTTAVGYVLSRVIPNDKRQFRALVGWGLAEYIWWIYGNRYEYSSFDIKQSYVFSLSYSPLLNPLCLIINSLSPYLLSHLFSLFDTYQTQLKVNKNLTEIYHQVCENSNKMVQYRTIRSVEEAELLEDTYYHTCFLLKPVIWSISSSFNLVYNQGKILFTVVYVPMTIIESGKFYMLAFLLCISIIWRSIIKNTQ